MGDDGSLLSRVDHLVFVTSDVKESMRFLSRKLGVTARAGGRHPAWGTRNALLALGPLTYLEIMGPDPELSRPGLVRPFGIDRLGAPHLATWVARSANLAQTVETGKRLGVDLGAPVSGNRTRPDGTALSWTMTDLRKDREGGIVPYFIGPGRPRAGPSRNAGKHVHPDRADRDEARVGRDPLTVI